MGRYMGTSEVGAGRGGAKASGGQRCEHLEDETLKMKVFSGLHLTWVDLPLVPIVTGKLRRELNAGSSHTPMLIISYKLLN